MKIEILNNKVISSASFTYNTKFPMLIINTHDKYIYHDSITYAVHNNSIDDCYYEYTYYLNDINYLDDDSTHDYVRLIADTEEDKHLLFTTIEFTMHDKNQWVILFINGSDIDEKHRRTI